MTPASQRGCPEDPQHGRFWLPRGRSWLPRFKKDARKPNSMAAGAHLRARARPLPWDIHLGGSSFASASTPPAVGYPFWRELIYERGHAPCRGVFILAGAHPRARARALVQCSAFGKYLRFRALPLWLAIQFLLLPKRERRKTNSIGGVQWIPGFLLESPMPRCPSREGNFSLRESSPGLLGTPMAHGSPARRNGWLETQSWRFRWIPLWDSAQPRRRPRSRLAFYGARAARTQAKR